MCRSLLVLGSLICLLVSGCASLSPGEPPVITLVNVRFDNITAFETSASITVRVENPNPEPLVLTGAVHELKLNGHALGRGMSGELLEVPRLGSATQDITVHVGNLGLLLQGMEIMKATRFTYDLQSKLYQRGGFLRPSLTVKSTGTIDLAEPQTKPLRSFLAAPAAGQP